MLASTGRKGGAGDFLIDINGPKKPNKSGRDLFGIDYYYDGSLDDGTTPECRRGQGGCQGATIQDSRIGRFDGACTSGIYGGGCLGKIMDDNWKMDY